MNEIITKIINKNPAYRNIVERTSVRRYTDQTITDDEKTALLYAAMCAPTGVNCQPWEFMLIDDKQILKSLADALPYAKMAATAPMAIMVCGNKERFLDGDDSTLWEQDLSAASENILLATHALGLGGVWTCLYPHSDRMEAAMRILNLPDNFVPFNLIPIGHPVKISAPRDKWHTDRIHHAIFK
ncbi:MAG: nitroreductase family protein [Muribaculaceae bacterium]|nr:nitroreductase family protein [Muribaculaceae bacterium]